MIAPLVGTRAVTKLSCNGEMVKVIPVLMVTGKVDPGNGRDQEKLAGLVTTVCLPLDWGGHHNNQPSSPSQQWPEKEEMKC